MNRPTTAVKLPISGYTAHVATFMTYLDRQEIAKAVIRNQRITEQTANEMVGGRLAFDGENALDSEKVMITRMTVKLEDEAGAEVPSTEILNLPDEDVDLVIAELAKIQTAKKKS